MDLAYAKIDAFTLGKSAGNPAACVYLEREQTLPGRVMQAIAAEHKGFVSEVAFCTPYADMSYALRYFSSECEVDFCGHATIACMYTLLKGDRSVAGLSEVAIHTSKGTLPVYNEIENLDAVFISAPEPQDKPVSLSLEEAAGSLGVQPEQIGRGYPIEAINAGLTTLIVPMNGLDACLGLAPDIETLKKLCLAKGVDIILVFSTETAHPENLIRTRVFAPKFGYLEDTATGSGNGAMGYYMLRRGMWHGEPIAIEQNGERDLFNLVRLKTRESEAGLKVLFGGRGTTKILGRYFYADS